MLRRTHSCSCRLHRQPHVGRRGRCFVRFLQNMYALDLATGHSLRCTSDVSIRLMAEERARLRRSRYRGRTSKGGVLEYEDRDVATALKL